VEALSRRRDGVYRWFLVQGTPLRDDTGRISRWHLTATDTEDRKKAADKIRQDERELRTIVDFLPQILVVCDAENRVVYANHAALAFTGRTLEETMATPTSGPRSSIRTICPRYGRCWKGWQKELGASSSPAFGDQMDSTGGSWGARRRCAMARVV
jgi:hypothetical protein